MNNSQERSADSSLEHVAIVREFARITRGEHPKWEGDRIANSDAFAFHLGYTQRDAARDLVQSLADAEHQYSLLTGLPPSSLRRMRDQLRTGIKSASSASALPNQERT